MKTKSLVLPTLMVAAATAIAGDGGWGSKPTGFRFLDNRLTIRPYVDVTYNYDGNIDTTSDSAHDTYFTVKPGANFEWRGDRWQITGSVWWEHEWYQRYGDQLGEENYGESLSYAYTTVGEDGRGWNLLLSEKFAHSSDNDSLGSYNGRGIWRDRDTVNVAGALERRFTERWHAAVNGQYDWLDYDNKTGYYAPLYGWSEWGAGLDAGFVLTKWTDLIVDGGYSRYIQKQGNGAYRHYDNNSESWTVQGGIGTHATEKITYRVLAGWSTFSYAGVSDADNGWVYSLSGNWRITRNLQWSALGSSYYQPSERALGTAIKVYTISSGLSYLMFGDRLTLTGDFAWRFEENVYNDTSIANEEYDEDIVTFRLGASYTINRWVSVFGNVSYEEEFCDDKSLYEYDRFRATLGLRFHY